MKKTLSVILGSLLILTASRMAQATEQHKMAMDMETPPPASTQQVISAQGVIKAIDYENKKISIAHEAIPALQWPAMTMRFTWTTTDESINTLAVGNTVKFTFIQQGNISLLQSITQATF